jgi:hypothetical protein
VFVLTGIKLLKDDIISLFLQMNPTNRGNKHKIRIICTHYKKLRDGVKKRKIIRKLCHMRLEWWDPVGKSRKSIVAPFPCCSTTR